MSNSQSQTEETFPLKLIAKERQLLVSNSGGLEPDTAARLREKMPKSGFALTFDQLEDLAIHVTDLMQASPQPKTRQAFDALFRKVSGVMRLAAQQEQGDEDLKSVISLQQARAVQSTAAEAAAAHTHLDNLADSLTSHGLIDATGIPIPTKVVRKLIKNLPVPDKLRQRVLAKDFQPTGRDALDLCRAVVQLLAEDPSEENAQLLNSFRQLPLDSDPELRLTESAPRKGKARPANVVFQLKITLKGSKPAIWRRLQVKDCKLSRLHDIIQVVMGWEDCHLHQFDIDGRQFSRLKAELAGDLDVEDADDYLLSELLQEKTKFRYEYDFGDGWEHQLTVEKVIKPEQGTQYPVCLAGARACPPEDVGGVWGYESFLQARQDPKHPEHADMMEWHGPFDPEAFDGEAVNRTLRRGR
jgi:hypothetical protein